MKLEFSRQIFEKYSNIKCEENRFIGSRVVPGGLTDGRTDRQAYMSKLTVVFRNFANAPKNFWVFCLLIDMIYLLAAIGLPPGGSSTVHIYTQAIHITTQNKQYTEQHKHFGRVRAVPRLGELYPGICITTEKKARKTLRQGSRILGIQESKIFDKDWLAEHGLWMVSQTSCISGFMPRTLFLHGRMSRCLATDLLLRHICPVFCLFKFLHTALKRV
jgi:hypothetical protein